MGKLDVVNDCSDRELPLPAQAFENLALRKL
jgi:hypothetical protein